ncbi:aspartate--tRNA(Asn) ligase [Candidatus Gracilibacteria bacterium]|nr:aspartate--tRNA(Asn) ligase [Candidatus Gracilibacteria bacterium]MCF7898419.1 aspartate--tRNA(Asn) ligase [Candidatus Paceibacterota bacterium]
MARTYIKDISKSVGSEVTVKGWIDVRRDQGKMVFLDLRDVTGKVQAVVLPNHVEALDVAQKVRPEWIVSVTAQVNKRPERNIKEGVINGDVELEVLTIEVIAEAQDVPFELGSEVNLDTHLDLLPYTLRGEKYKSIFKVQSTILKAFREFLITEGFTEFQAPKLIGEDAEGGANSFDLEYFGHTAHLAQSPQFYKQIMVGVFERVFTTGNVYRAEKHATSRHLNEYTSLDFEMGFIKDHTDIIEMETSLLRYIISALKKECTREFELLNATFPELPENVPVMKLREAQQIIKKEFGEDCSQEPDLEPQHERWLCEYAKKNFNSDFIFITHFPISKRPMYTYEDENDIGYAKGFDLLFRGVEITTGGQRIHNYEKLVKSMENKGLNSNQFRYYLQAFKYGMPPHGGLGLGLERITSKFLGLENIKEATMFPRDINRIDNLLSQ